MLTSTPFFSSGHLTPLKSSKTNASSDEWVNTAKVLTGRGQQRSTHQACSPHVHASILHRSNAEIVNVSQEGMDRTALLLEEDCRCHTSLSQVRRQLTTPPPPPQGEHSVLRPIPIQRFSKLAHPFLQTSLLLCDGNWQCEGRGLKWSKDVWWRCFPEIMVRGSGNLHLIHL